MVYILLLYQCNDSAQNPQLGRELTLNIRTFKFLLFRICPIVGRSKGAYVQPPNCFSKSHQIFAGAPKTSPITKTGSKMAKREISTVFLARTTHFFMTWTTQIDICERHQKQETVDDGIPPSCYLKPSLFGGCRSTQNQAESFEVSKVLMVAPTKGIKATSIRPWVKKNAIKPTRRKR